VVAVKWTADEDERLRKLAAAGRSTATIAERLKRSASSVRDHARKLGIAVAKVGPRKAMPPRVN
jgi:DNA-binding CsgD family transcriptional regulator